ncbi:cysteine protease domain, YopT-type [Providencia rustigianii]|nr:cysteine protease domain, YopT-type [Providencia rustigianii]
MINLHQFTYKFNQYKIIDHFKNTIKNDFSRNVIGVSNMNELENGVCYGLTHAFLRYAHANHEKTYIKEFYRNVKHVKGKKHPSSEKVHFINELFYTAARIQMQSAYAINLNNAISSFKFPNRQENEVTLNYFNRLFSINNFKFQENNLSELETIKFLHFVKGVYLYTYFTNQRNQLSRNKSASELDILKKVSKDIRKKCSNYLGSDLATTHISVFFELVKNYQTKIIKNNIENENHQYGISYDSYTTIDGIIDSNIYNKITLDQFKQRINNRLKQKQDTLCDFLSRYHAMGVSIKHIGNKVEFKFFDPNNGLFVSTDKKKFFKLLDKVATKHEFHKDSNNSPLVEINTSFANEVNLDPLINKIKEPKLYS